MNADNTSVAGFKTALEFNFTLSLGMCEDESVENSMQMLDLCKLSLAKIPCYRLHCTLYYPMPKIVLTLSAKA